MKLSSLGPHKKLSACIEESNAQKKLSDEEIVGIFGQPVVLPPVTCRELIFFPNTDSEDFLERYRIGQTAGRDLVYYSPPIVSGYTRQRSLRRNGQKLCFEAEHCECTTEVPEVPELPNQITFISMDEKASYDQPSTHISVYEEELYRQSVESRFREPPRRPLMPVGQRRRQRVNANRGLAVERMINILRGLRGDGNDEEIEH